MDDQPTTTPLSGEEEKKEVVAPESEEGAVPAVGEGEETPAVGEEEEEEDKGEMPIKPEEPVEGAGTTE